MVSEEWRVERADITARLNLRKGVRRGRVARPSLLVFTTTPIASASGRRMPGLTTAGPRTRLTGCPRSWRR